MSFFKENIQILKRGFIPLFIIGMTYGIAEQYISERIQLIVRNSAGPDYSLVIFFLLSLSVSLIFPVLMALSAIHAFRDRSETLIDFIHRTFNQLLVEEIRAWGKILLYLLFFIFPGLIKLIQLSLIPFIVTENKDYEKGTVDALDLSKKLVNTRFASVFGVLFFFNFFLPLFLTTLFDGYSNVFKTPVSSIILYGISAYFYIFGFQLLFKIYQSTSDKFNRISAKPELSNDNEMR